jgi:hypothetical protein
VKDQSAEAGGVSGKGHGAQSGSMSRTSKGEQRGEQSGSSMSSNEQCQGNKSIKHLRSDISVFSFHSYHYMIGGAD